MLYWQHSIRQPYVIWHLVYQCGSQLTIICYFEYLCNCLNLTCKRSLQGTIIITTPCCTNPVTKPRCHNEYFVVWFKMLCLIIKCFFWQNRPYLLLLFLWHKNLFEFIPQLLCHLFQRSSKCEKQSSNFVALLFCGISPSDILAYGPSVFPKASHDFSRTQLTEWIVLKLCLYIYIYVRVCACVCI